MKVLIIIPAYNESENIETVVDALIRDCPLYDYIIIDDGSSDNTESLCNRKKYNYIKHPINLGLACSFRTGMKYAFKYGYDCALQFDGDGQHDAQYIAAMVKVMQEQRADIVIGSRYVNKKKNIRLRELGNSIISFLIYLTTGTTIHDTTSGMRLFNSEIIEKYAREINYSPEPDTIAYLLRLGYSVKEIPVIMREREFGESYLNWWNGVKYMVNICTSIVFIQWFRRKK